jgi:hypothetical protein
MNGPARSHDWPSLLVDERTATRDDLPMWVQIIGKIRMVHLPLLNHWWPVSLFCTPRELITGMAPYRDSAFDVEFDLVNHMLVIRNSDGRQEVVPLAALPDADFYAETLWGLDWVDRVDGATRVVNQPNEFDPAIPLAADYLRAEYEPDAAHTVWQQLLRAHQVMTDFRAVFVGKGSPVQFVCGAVDFACTLLSGRPAPHGSGRRP